MEIVGMTILFSVVTREYILNASDMRTTIESGGRFLTADESFSKQIFFQYNEMPFGAMFTGLAHWTDSNNKRINLYDLLADSIEIEVKRFSAHQVNNITLFISSVLKELDEKVSKTRGSFHREKIEIIFSGFESKYGLGIMICASTYRTKSPFKVNCDSETFWKTGRFSVYVSGAFNPEVIIAGSGSAHCVSGVEVERLAYILSKNPKPYHVAKFICKIVEAVSKRTATVNNKVTFTLIPRIGQFDAFYYGQEGVDFSCYTPLMIFPGTRWNPAVFPFEISGLFYGRIEKNNLFAHALLDKKVKRRVRRKILRHNSKDIAPYLFDFFSFCFYGQAVSGTKFFNFENE